MKETYAIKDALVLVYGTWYIDPVCFLQMLKERDKLLLERIAVPGVDHDKTEGLRGLRVEVNNLIQQLEKCTNGN